MMHLIHQPLELVTSVTIISIEMLKRSGLQKPKEMRGTLDFYTLIKGMIAEEDNMVETFNIVIREMIYLEIEGRDGAPRPLSWTIA